MSTKQQEKALSPAQRQHLRQLYITAQQAQAEVNRFVGYIQAEHDAVGWSVSSDMDRLIAPERDESNNE